MNSNDTWDVFAVEFSAWEGRLRHENFIIADPHDGRGPLFFVYEKGTVPIFLPQGGSGIASRVVRSVSSW